MMLANSIGRAYKYLFSKEEWNVGVVRQPISVFLEQNARPCIHWLPPLKRGKYIADPFALARKRRTYILCEEFDYETAKGRIVSIELGDTQSPSPPEKAIELPVHVSYPYLLELEGEVFCIPETSQLREVSLYKAEDFPRRWVKVATLIDDFAASDPTLFQHEGLWWIACTGEYGDEKQANLFLWYASEILGPWKAHRANPVKRDIRSSRPAGTPFMHKGDLYRPAQDCSRTYGGRIVLNQVAILTATEFDERQAAVIEPDRNGPYPDGMHTLSAAGNFTLVDGKRYVFVKSHLKRILLRNTAALRTCASVIL